MKNLRFILFIALAGFFVGCSSDDDGGGGTISASIIGTWNSTDVDAGGEVSTVVSGQNIVRPIAAEPSNNNYVLTFNEDNTVTAVGNFDLDLTVSFLGETFDETFENVAPVGVGTWTLVGNSLTITSNGESQVLMIEELSENELTLYVENSIVETINGFDFDADLELRMFFERQ